MIYKIMLSDELCNAFNIEDKQILYESCLDAEDTLDQVRIKFKDQISKDGFISIKKMFLIYNGITIEGTSKNA